MTAREVHHVLKLKTHPELSDCQKTEAKRDIFGTLQFHTTNWSLFLKAVFEA